MVNSTGKGAEKRAKSAFYHRCGFGTSKLKLAFEQNGLSV